METNIQRETHFYIINLLTDTRVDFKVFPEELSESVSASFGSQPIRGRSAPYFSFESNGARTVGFSLTLHEELCDGGLWSTVNKLKALVYPAYNGPIVMSPKCYIRFGNMVGMRAIIESLSVSWEPPMIKDKNGRMIYSRASISFDFSEYVVEAFHDVNSIENTGGLKYMTGRDGSAGGSEVVTSDRYIRGGRVDQDR